MTSGRGRGATDAATRCVSLRLPNSFPSSTHAHALHTPAPRADPPFLPSRSSPSFSPAPSRRGRLLGFARHTSLLCTGGVPPPAGSTPLARSGLPLARSPSCSSRSIVLDSLDVDASPAMDTPDPPRRACHPCGGCGMQLASRSGSSPARCPNCGLAHPFTPDAARRARKRRGATDTPTFAKGSYVRWRRPGSLSDAMTMRGTVRSCTPQWACVRGRDAREDADDDHRVETWRLHPASPDDAERDEPRGCAAPTPRPTRKRTAPSDATPAQCSSPTLPDAQLRLANAASPDAARPDTTSPDAATPDTTSLDAAPRTDGPPADPEPVVVHLLARGEVERVAHEYCRGTDFAKNHHRKALAELPEDAALLVVVPRTSRLPHADARSLLLYTRRRHGCVCLVHTRSAWTHRGYALRLARAVVTMAPLRGSLSVDSPACTTLAAVRLWLQAGFVCDEEILRCELSPDDAASVGEERAAHVRLVRNGQRHDERRVSTCSPAWRPNTRR